ncbi:TlpA family protein disulfide reductase [Tenacibaculum aestuariivivum]|uniref:TlpA family protein disulfide reductase n=1 Tax=Tenacibaculum aestuariivivum TaxID=2006131 RepID=UPI003AB729E6
MKSYIFLAFCGFFFIKCVVKSPTEFSKEALEDVFISINKKEVRFKDILEENKNKKIVIDVWASWCKDCLESLPDVKKLQIQNPSVVFVYLSLDRDVQSWKLSVDRLNLKGEHYFMPSGWKGSLAKFLGLNYIPRYLVVSEDGKIIIFNKTKITHEVIIKAIN